MQNEIIGKRIKERRNKVNISAVELAGITGLSKATIHRYESGDIKNIKMPVIETIAKFLDVSSEWLLGETNDPKRYDSTNEKDLEVILRYALKVIRSTEFTHHGKPVPEDAVNLIEMGIVYSLAILEHEDGK